MIQLAACSTRPLEISIGCERQVFRKVKDFLRIIEIAGQIEAIGHFDEIANFC